MELVKPGTDFRIVERSKTVSKGSVVMVLVFLTLIIAGALLPDSPIAPKFGVDFAGGTEIQLSAPDKDIAEIREGLAAMGLADDSVQEYGGIGAGQYLVRIEDVNFAAEQNASEISAVLASTFGDDFAEQLPIDGSSGGRVTYRLSQPLEDVQFAPAPGAPGLFGTRGIRAALTSLGDIDVRASRSEHNSVELTLPGLVTTVQETLDEALGAGTFTVERVESVGPKVGAELRQNGILSVLAALALILVYVAFRFELSFAPGAVAALFHDVIFIVGLFIIFGVEFNLSIIAALLTVVGYSLNDTIVVYDRIRENIRRMKGEELPDIVNRSLNQTMSRTVLTSVTTLVTVSFLRVFGGPIIADFATAMVLGVVVGTYSSLFVASPIVLFLDRWMPVNMDPDAPVIELQGDGAVV